MEYTPSHPYVTLILQQTPSLITYASWTLCLTSIRFVFLYNLVSAAHSHVLGICHIGRSVSGRRDRGD